MPTDVVSVISYLKDASAVTALLFIGWASYTRKWMWRKDHDDDVAELKAQIAEAKTTAAEWKQVAWQSLGFAQTGVGLAVMRSSRKPEE